MLKKIVYFVLGIIMTSYALMFIIIYLNLLKMGYSFLEYLKYIFTRFECLILFLVILLICLSFRKDKKKYELHLQYKSKS